MGLKQLFRLKSGKHAGKDARGNLKTYTKGQIISSTEDLTEKFPEKFEKVNQDDVDQTKGAVDRAMKLREAMEKKKAEESEPEDEESEVAVEETNDEEESESEEEEQEESSGEPADNADVTDRFPILKKVGLSVKYDGDNYFVMKGDKSLTAEGLSDNKAVMKWFKKWNTERKK